jgi:hypothetical protein
MNIDDAFDENIDWSTVPLPEGNATSATTSSHSTIPNETHNPNNITHHNTNHESIDKPNQHNTGSIQNNVSITNLQARLSQLENLLAEKDSRLFDLESSIATLEAETQFSIQSANQSQQMIQMKEEELKRMQQIIEKKNMVIVRLQKKKKREAVDAVSPSLAGNHFASSSSSPVGISEQFQNGTNNTDRSMDVESKEHQQKMHDTDNTSIGVQTDDYASNAVMDPLTHPRKSAWRLLSCLPSVQSLHLNFSSQEKWTIPQLCRLILSRIYSHDDLDLMVALYDLCSASVDVRDFIRWTFDSEDAPPMGRLSARMSSTSRIRGMTLSNVQEEDHSDMTKGRLGPILITRIVGKKDSSSEEEMKETTNEEQNEWRNICLKIILVLMHNAPNESGIWNFGISFMDEYFSDILQLLEKKSSTSLDYVHKQYIIDVMAFTIEYKATRISNFFFQDTTSMERFLLAFTYDVKSQLSHLDDLINDPECYGLQYLLSLIGLFDSLVQFKDGFDLVRAQVKYNDKQFASCIGMAFSTMDKEMHLLEKNRNTIHVSTELRHQIVRRCVQFFYRLNLYSESTASGKRAIALIDILQDVDITHRLVFCLRSVIRFRNRNKNSHNELFEEKTRGQATTLLQSIQKGLKSIQER